MPVIILKLVAMKVSIFTLEYPPYVYGGAGVHVYNIAKRLAKFINVEIRTLFLKREADLLRKDDIIVKRYPCWYDIVEKTQRKYRPVFKAMSLALAINADKVEADIVHYHTWYMSLAGFMAKKLYNTKLITTVHSLEPRRLWKRSALAEAYNLSSWLEKTGLEACDMIIAVSNFMKNDIVKVYGIDRDKIEVIYNGIDEALWRPVIDENILRKYGIKRPYILFVGRLSVQKGIFTLLEAFKHLSTKATLVLVTGKPDSKEVLERFREAAENLKNVVWINKMLKSEELIPLYTMASVFVCPSIYEPFGIVNLEAMATETPVVASRTGGIPEIVVDGENGILVKPGDARELKDAIEYVLDNSEEGRTMGERGRKRVLQYFSWSKIANKTLKLYRRIVKD